MTLLKLLDKDDAEVRFRLKESPFTGNESDEQLAADKREEFIVTGQIFPKSDIFRERSYLIEMKLPKSFPMLPPVVRFLTPIYHPNVGTDGKFCNELLEKNVGWTPTSTLVDVVKVVVNRIDHPDIDFSFSFALGQEYQNNRAEFNRKALEYVLKHGLPR